MPMTPAQIRAMNRRKRGLKLKRRGGHRFYRKKGRARPISKLNMNYRQINSYRFVRESVPEHTSFNLIAAGGSLPAMGYLSFDNLKMDILPGFSEFQSLFARYKVDMIITTLTPLWGTTNYPMSTLVGDGKSSPELAITRLNTKWLNEPWQPELTAGAQQTELAQIQGKTRTLYSSRKPLKIITRNPRQYGYRNESNDLASAQPISVSRPGIWLDTSSSSDAVLCHNQVILAERIDGGDLNTGWRYEVRHKIIFRCSQVG